VTSLNPRVCFLFLSLYPRTTSRSLTGYLLLVASLVLVHPRGTHHKAPPPPSCAHGDCSSSSSLLSPQHAPLRIDRLVVRPPPNVSTWLSTSRPPSPPAAGSPRRLEPPRLCSQPALAMPPLAPPHGEKGGRQRQGAAAAPAPAQRSASFHGRGTEQRHHQPQKQRPKTLPDLLAGVRGASFRSGSPPPDGDAGRRTPSKVLVSVAVQQSMWPLHVMAPAEWTVADLVAAAVALYVKEGRRPLLPSTDPAAFGLHYSQFSLDSTFLESPLLGRPRYVLILVLVACYLICALLWLS
jgi:hypothetical protein